MVAMFQVETSSKPSNSRRGRFSDGAFPRASSCIIGALIKARREAQQRLPWAVVPACCLFEGDANFEERGEHRRKTEAGGEGDSARTGQRVHGGSTGPSLIDGGVEKHHVE
eukprot:6850964-Prymnesium_polylepis.1